MAGTLVRDTTFDTRSKNPQQLLEAYVSCDPHVAGEIGVRLSEIIASIVRKSIGKREVSDIDDFEEECLLAVWSKVQAVRDGVSETEIKNLDAFVRQAVHNRYSDAIRKKRPKWYNLKIELMELLSGKAGVRGLAMWSGDGKSDRMCGFDSWQEMRPANAKCRELCEKTDVFRRKFLKNADATELPLHELVAAVLDYCGGPLGIDVLTSAIVELTHARPVQSVSIDSFVEDEEGGSLSDWLISADTDIEKDVVEGSWFGDVMSWFWNEFAGLSEKQRKAVLYGMSSEQVMIIASKVGLGQLAASVSASREEMAVLIESLPMADSDTADVLKVQVRAVPSIRFKAWGRIRRRIRKSVLYAGDEQ
jgi:hypothetical protein